MASGRSRRRSRSEVSGFFTSWATSAAKLDRVHAAVERINAAQRPREMVDLSLRSEKSGSSRAPLTERRPGRRRRYGAAARRWYAGESRVDRSIDDDRGVTRCGRRAGSPLRSLCTIASMPPPWGGELQRRGCRVAAGRIRTPRTPYRRRPFASSEGVNPTVRLALEI